MSAGHIKAGDLKRQISLMRPESTIDSKNRRTTEYKEAARVWAAKNDVSGREFYMAHGVNAEDIITYTIRWRSDMTTAWRVRDHGSVYGIVEINHLGYMRDYMRLKCREVTRGGA